MAERLTGDDVMARPRPWPEAVANLRDLTATYERGGEWGMANICLREAEDAAREGGADATAVAAIGEAREALHERETAHAAH